MKLLSRSAVVAIALAFASAAPAQDKPVQLKFSHWVPPTHPMHAAAVAWAESIDKASARRSSRSSLPTARKEARRSMRGIADTPGKK